MYNVHILGIEINLQSDTFGELYIRILMMYKIETYLSRFRYMISRPAAGQVDTNTGNHSRGIAQAHCSQVQGVGRHDVRGLRQIF